MSEVPLYDERPSASRGCLRERDNRLRAQRETTGYEPRERQQVTSPERDNRLRAQNQTTGYEPRERQQVTIPERHEGRLTNLRLATRACTGVPRS